MNGDLKHLRRNGFAETFADHAGTCDCTVRMADGGEGVNRFAVDENLQLDRRGWLVSVRIVVHGTVAACAGLELVVEIKNDFMERHTRRDHDMEFVDGLRAEADTAFVQHEIHDIAHVGRGRDDLRFDHGLLHMVDRARIWHVERIVYLLHGSVLKEHMVDDGGICENQIHIVFAREALLDDIHVEQAEEAAAEARAEGDGAFRLGDERAVVEPQFRDVEFQRFVVRRVDGIDAREDHGADFLEARKRFVGGIDDMGDRIADGNVRRRLDGRDDVADFACAERIGGLHARREETDFLHIRVQ